MAYYNFCFRLVKKHTNNNGTNPNAIKYIPAIRILLLHYTRGKLKNQTQFQVLS